MRPKTVLSWFLLIALAAAACSDDSGTTTTATAVTTAPATTPATTATPGSCSAAGMAALDAQDGLPGAVAAMRGEIAGAAVACDLERFAELASGGPGEFIFAGGEILFFVGPLDEAVEFLSGFEADGVDFLAEAVALLVLPFGFVEDPEPWGLLDDPALAPLYVWPAAAAHSSWSEVPDAEREAIRSLLGGRALQLSAEQGRYLGPRLGITESGDWVFQHFGHL